MLELLVIFELFRLYNYLARKVEATRWSTPVVVPDAHPQFLLTYSVPRSPRIYVKPNPIISCLSLKIQTMQAKHAANAFSRHPRLTEIIMKAVNFVQSDSLSSPRKARSACARFRRVEKEASSSSLSPPSLASSAPLPPLLSVPSC